MMNLPIEGLENKVETMDITMSGKVLITGISGMIGGMIARILQDSESFRRGKIQIIGISRERDKAIVNLGSALCEKITLVEADIVDTVSLEQIEAVDVIIHCAAVTASSEMVTHPVEVADGIVLGTRNMLELAKRCHVKSMVYLSSMEVYGAVSDIGRPRLEEELGDINLDAPRSCYPMAKRMAEHYCHIYQKEYGVPVKIARLAQTFGKGVRQDDNRVYMQFARAAMEGKNIILKTPGTSMGNYCETKDAVNAIFTILEKGIDGETYNVVNEANTMRIRDMANLVAEHIAKGKIEVIIQAEDSAVTGYAPDTSLRMSSEKLRALGWGPTKGLEEMFRDVIDCISKEPGGR